MYMDARLQQLLPANSMCPYRMIPQLVNQTSAKIPGKLARHLHSYPSDKSLELINTQILCSRYINCGALVGLLGRQHCMGATATLCCGSATHQIQHANCPTTVAAQQPCYDATAGSVNSLVETLNTAVWASDLSIMSRSWRQPLLHRALHI